MKALVVNRPHDPEFKATIASLKKAHARITFISEEQAEYYSQHGTLSGFNSPPENSTSSHSEQRS
jgi:hypothetical protein